MGAVFLTRAATQEVEIHIYEDIGGGGWFGEGLTAKTFQADLKAAGNPKNIKLRISSFGGDVFEGLTIYRLLADHEARIKVHVDGIAASIASVIAMAGDEIVISESGYLMIHDAWGFSQGNATEMRAYADQLESVSKSLADVYVARTGLPLADIREMMAAETWLDSRTAVEKGFANSVAENVRIAARLDPTRHKFKNAPSLVVPAEPPVDREPRPLADQWRNKLLAQQLRYGVRRAG